MSKIKKVVLSPGDEIEIDLNGGDRPKSFFRVTGEIVFGLVPCENERKGIVYLFQKHSDGTYHFAGILDIEPLKTTHEIKGVKNPFQITGLMDFRNAGLSVSEELAQHVRLMFEDTDVLPNVINPKEIKFILGVE